MYFEAKQFNKKKGSPQQIKYKLPSAVRTLVIYFCQGGILIVKWKGLYDFLGQNYLLIFLLAFSCNQQRHQNRDWQKRIFSNFPGWRLFLVRTLTWWQKKLLLLTLIGESEQIKRSMIRLYICYQSKFNQMVSRIIPNRCACLSECMVRTQYVKVLFPTKRNCSWNVNFFYLAKRGLEGFVVRVSECPSVVLAVWI